MKRPRILAVAGALVACSLALFGCSSSPKDSSGGDSGAAAQAEAPNDGEAGPPEADAAEAPTAASLTEDLKTAKFKLIGSVLDNNNPEHPWIAFVHFKQCDRGGTYEVIHADGHTGVMVTDGHIFMEVPTGAEATQHKVCAQ